ncbi:MAG: transglycosylase SLT domain-containing protein [bacterium]|nr:transglycosylase SLT domain-containing protein [bacterium]
MKANKKSKYTIILTLICLAGSLLLLPQEGSPASEQKMMEEITKLLLSEISKLSSRISNLEQQNKTLTRMVSRMMEEQENGGRLLPEQVQDHLAKRYELPKVVSLCNERIPLDKWDVWQRLDSEFFSFLVNEKQVILWLKRTGQFFPYIEEELEKAGLPDDLKYVTIVESGLRSGATSHAGAAGFWQFIKSTGNDYGLTQNSWLDNRRDLYASTNAAIKYLDRLYGMFHDWPLALASYNTGEGRVQRAMKAQGVHNYYQLELSRETERYVFKIIAAKIILSDPKKYGFYIDEDNMFPPYQFENVSVKLPKSTHIRELSRMYGSYYREFRLLNPEIQKDMLPAGKHTIKVPKGWQRIVERLPKHTESAEYSATNDGIIYIVKSGDSLGWIAKKFNVRIKDIKRINGKSSSLTMLHPGDKLLIVKK